VVLVCGFLHFCREKGEKTGKKSLFCRVSSFETRNSKKKGEKEVEIKQQPESRFEDKKKGEKERITYIHIILCVLVLSFR
jgi:hypothetical protein